MTQNPWWRKTHPSFKLNGVHYQFDELQEAGYSLIKEGESFEKAIGDFLIDWGTDHSEVVVQTSGSTGTPKNIALKKEHMMNSAEATGQYFGLVDGDAALLCLPCSGIAGKMMLVRAMVLGLELDYVNPSSTPLAVSNKTYDFSAMVPLQVEKSLEQLSQIDALIIGGAPVSSGLRQKLQSVSTRSYETYGMTETITHVAVKPISNSKSKDPKIQETIFTALPNISFSQDSRGCLVIDAPKILDDKITTNDIVELINTTQFSWLGRYDSIINSGGIKLIPEHIEQKLTPIISSRFFVAGIPDKTLGQKLVLVIEAGPHDRPKLLEQIKSIDGLNKFEVPKEIFFLPTFIETANGKVQRTSTMKVFL